MTNILSQAQGVFGSFFLGMIFLLLWSVLNRAFYKYNGKLFRLLFELFFFIFYFYLYFKFLIVFTKGVYNIFYFISFGLGVIVYYKFYHPKFLIVIEEVIEALSKHIITPLKLKIEFFCDKIKNASKEILNNGKKTKLYKSINKYCLRFCHHRSYNSNINSSNKIRANSKRKQKISGNKNKNRK